jgi:hypothetical protein
MEAKMPKSKLSSGHSFFLGIMALMIAVLCVTIRVVHENLEARIIMTGIWAIIATWWLIQSALSRRANKEQDVEQINR